MPELAENITGIYERKLIRKLVQTDEQTRFIFKKYADKTGDIFSRYRANYRGIIVHNQDLDREYEEANKWLQSNLEGLIKNNQNWAWMAANEKNDQIIGSFIDKLPLAGRINLETGGKSFDLYARNLEALSQFQTRNVNGMNLSDKVWKLTKANTEIMDYYLESGTGTGRAASSIARDIRQLLNKPDNLFRRVRDPETGQLKLSNPAKAYKPGRGVYRSSVQNARRLARTEVNMAYRASDFERWNKLDFILGIEVKLSNAHPRPDICDQAAGMYPKGFKFIGWHPQCICHAVPVLPTDDQFLDWAMDDKELTGFVSDVPKSFKNWINDNKEKVSKWASQPYFIRDNFRGGRIENGVKESIVKG